MTARERIIASAARRSALGVPATLDPITSSYDAACADYLSETGGKL